MPTKCMIPNPNKPYIGLGLVIVVTIILIWKKRLTGEEYMNLLDRIRTGFLKIAGYLVPLLQPVPGLGFFLGMVVVPLIMILIPMFVFLPYSIQAFFFYPGLHYPGSLLPLTRAFIIFGFLMLVYSTAYLRIRRKEGLVTSGLYRLVRHPQYLGIILSTLGFTSWSYWFLTHLIFYSEFLDAKGTIVESESIPEKVGKRG